MEKEHSVSTLEECNIADFSFHTLQLGLLQNWRESGHSNYCTLNVGKNSLVVL